LLDILANCSEGFEAFEADLFEDGVLWAFYGSGNGVGKAKTVGH